MSSSSSSSYGYCSDIIYGDGFSISGFNEAWNRAGEWAGKPYWKKLISSTYYYIYWNEITKWYCGSTLGAGSIVYESNPASDRTCPYGTGCATWNDYSSGEPVGRFCNTPQDSSSSSSGIKVFNFDKYLTINEPSNMNKDHFLTLYDGKTTGKTKSDKVFHGDAGTGTFTFAHYVSLKINGSVYYTPVYTGDPTNTCCSILTGDIK